MQQQMLKLRNFAFMWFASLLRCQVEKLVLESLYTADMMIIQLLFESVLISVQELVLNLFQVFVHLCIYKAFLASTIFL